MLASIGEDLFRAVLQGAPPGTVYALVALGFVLTYKTSGVFNLAFGAQAYVSAASTSRPTPSGAGRSCRRSCCRSSSWRRCSASLLEWLIFRHLRTAPRGRQAGGDDRPVGRHPGDRSTSWRTSSPGPGGRPRASRRTAPTCSTTRSASTPFSRNELVGDGRRRDGDGRRSPRCSSSPPSACACGPWSRARG